MKRIYIILNIKKSIKLKLLIKGKYVLTSKMISKLYNKNIYKLRGISLMKKKYMIPIVILVIAIIGVGSFLFIKIQESIKKSIKELN